MKISVNAIYKQVGEKYKGNLSDFCRDLGLDYSGVWKVLNGRSSGSSKFIPALFKYCKTNGLNFNDFIS